MKYLYYPGFEINDEKWLKFALLFLDNVTTVMPKEGISELSESFKFITKETDLIRNIMPDYGKAEVATRETIQQIEEIIESPMMYFSSTRTVKPVETFRKEFDIELYSRKYNKALSDFLLDQGFAYKSENGIIVNRFISDLFMTNLSNEYYRTGDYNLVTDIKKQKYDTVVLMERETNIGYKELSELKIGIGMKMPNIYELEFNDLIDIRNSQDYLKNLKAFNAKLGSFRNEVNENIDRHNVQDFFRELEEYPEYLKKVKKLNGAAVTSAVITGVFTAASGFNPVLVAALLGEIGAGIGLQVMNRKSKNIEINKGAYKLISALE